MKLPPRLWFKWQRLKSAWRSRSGQAQPAEEAPVPHRMCPNCRALVGRDASVCPMCGVRLRRQRAPETGGRVLGIIPIPSTVTAALVAGNIALYAVAWYMSTAAAASEPGTAPALAGLRTDVLVRLGAKFGPAMVMGQWWRLVTAMFLHAGLLHIGLNLWCLVDLGPTVEALFSKSKFIVLYLASGVFGFAVSLWWNPWGISVGASGAILGLVGALLGASFHHGHLGKLYRAQLIRWVIYILVFGIFFRTDNAAHLGGLAFGALFGYVIPEGEPESNFGEALWNALALLSALIIAGSFALMALQLIGPAK